MTFLFSNQLPTPGRETSMCTRVRRREEAKEDHDDGCAAVVVVFVPTDRFLHHRLLGGCHTALSG